MQLVCPKCKRNLAQIGNQGYYCKNYNRVYKNDGVIIDFLIDYDKKLLECYENEAIQNYASETYLSSRRRDLFYRKRMDGILSLINREEIMNKKVLDSGCGCGIYTYTFLCWGQKKL